MIPIFIESLLVPEKILLLFALLFVIRFIFFTTLEYFFTAHPFNWKEVAVSDLTTMLFYTVIVFPVAQYISNHVGISGTFLSPLAQIPLPARILLFFVVSDFLHYWIHRLMHHKFLWRAHMWHHSLNHMSWMGGFRATVFDATLVNLGFIFAWPILGDVSYSLIVVILMINLLVNDWMHLNVRFHLPFLEKVIVTPRYHHIHHSQNKEHYMKNLSAIFSVWDRLFGTYANPDKTENKLTFGLDEKIKASRLVIGL